MNRRQQLWAAIVLVPAVLSSAIFVYGFVAWTGYVSLTDWNTVRRVKGFFPDAPLIGVANYQAVFNTPRFWTNDVFASIVFTLVFVIGCMFIIPIPWVMRWYTGWYTSQFALADRT